MNIIKHYCTDTKFLDAHIHSLHDYIVSPFTLAHVLLSLRESNVMFHAIVMITPWK